MPIRPLALPADLAAAAEVVGKAFRYPDHPEWELDLAEREQFAGVIRRIQRVWPAIRLLGLLSPSLRDLLQGFVWEEDGELAGFVVVQRDGQSSVWQIEPLGVLPRFRRQGIGRQLMTEALQMIRARGGRLVKLGVIEGNTPAQRLYSSMGFVEYSGTNLLVLTPSTRIEPDLLPAGYVESPLARFDWRTRHEMDLRITPPSARAFEAISPGRYRVPLLIRAVIPFFGNTHDHDMVIHRSSDHVAVARFGWSISKPVGGTNSIRVRLDPAHADLASYTVRRALSALLSRTLGQQVELFPPSWMPGVACAAEMLGYQHRRLHKSMGLEL